MRKIYSFNLDQDNIKRLDAIVQHPVSRSDIVDSMIEYVLQTPYILEHFVQSKLNEMQIKVNQAQ